MTIPTFDELCDGLLEYLRENAQAIEVTPDSIREGVLGKLPDWAAPYIAVYCDPVDSVQNASANPIYNIAAITLMIKCAGTATQAEALRACVRIAARTYRALVGWNEIAFDRRSLERYQAVGQDAMVTLRATHPFTLL